MLRATLRSLLARKVRLVLSALAIVIGVGFVAGAFVLTDSLGTTFDSLFDTVNSNVAVAIRGRTTTSGDTGDVRRPVPAATLARIRTVDGVAEAQGYVTGSAQVVARDGTAVTTGGAPTLGLTWVTGLLQSGHLVSGSGPVTDDQVVLTALTADKGDWHVGDRVPVLTEAGVTSYTLTGILEYDGNRTSLAGETTVFFTDAESHRAMNRAGRYDEIDVVAREGVSQQTLLGRITPVLPDGAEALTGKAYSDEQASDVKNGLRFFTTFLLVFASIALFVGAFIIFNTFSMLVAQRSRELALLRAIGASRGQVVRSVLLEAVVVGFLASALGLLAGVGLAEGLKALLKAFGADFPDTPTVIATRTVVVCFVVGIVVTAVAALLPARRGSRIAPVAALRDAAVADRPLGRQALAGVLLLAAGVVAIAAGLDGAPLLWLGLGALVAFVGIAALSPLLARPIAGTVAVLFRRGVPGRLGGQNTVRNPRRTAVTASALMIGLALISGVTVLGASFKESVAKVTRDSVGSDFILDTGTTSNSGFSRDVVERAQKVPGVGQLDTIKVASVRLTTGSTTSSVALLAVPARAIGTTLSVQPESGTTELGAGALLVSTTAATKHHLRTGSVVSAELPDGSTQQLTVRGTYAVNGLAGDFIVDASLVAHFADTRVDAALVVAAKGADLAQLRSGLTKAVAADPTVTVEDRTEFVKAAQDQVGQLVSFLDVLLALSVLIAILGVVNTLALSVIERTRELGLLRAVGLSRRQVKRMIRVESVVICVFGGVLGLLVGSAIGVALQNALKDQGVTELGLPVGTLLAYLLLAAVAGVLAAVLPARRAAKLDVLRAIATD